MDREVGAAVAQCPECGTELETEAQPDGSVVVADCPEHSQGQPEENPERAAQQPQELTREQGTDAPENTEGRK